MTKLYLLSDSNVYGFGENYINGIKLSNNQVIHLLDSVESIEAKASGISSWNLVKTDGYLYGYIISDKMGASGNTGVILTPAKYSEMTLLSELQTAIAEKDVSKAKDALEILQSFFPNQEAFKDVLIYGISDLTKKIFELGLEKKDGYLCGICPYPFSDERILALVDEEAKKDQNIFYNDYLKALKGFPESLKNVKVLMDHVRGRYAWGKPSEDNSDFSKELVRLFNDEGRGDYRHPLCNVALFYKKDRYLESVTIPQIFFSTDEVCDRYIQIHKADFDKVLASEISNSCINAMARAGLPVRNKLEEKLQKPIDFGPRLHLKDLNAKDREFVLQNLTKFNVGDPLTLKDLKTYFGNDDTYDVNETLEKIRELPFTVYSQEALDWLFAQVDINKKYLRVIYNYLYGNLNLSRHTFTSKHTTIIKRMLSLPGEKTEDGIKTYSLNRWECIFDLEDAFSNSDNKSYFVSLAIKDEKYFDEVMEDYKEVAKFEHLTEILRQSDLFTSVGALRRAGEFIRVMSACPSNGQDPPCTPTNYFLPELENFMTRAK